MSTKVHVKRYPAKEPGKVGRIKECVVRRERPDGSREVVGTTKTKRAAENLRSVFGKK